VNHIVQYQKMLAFTPACQYKPPDRKKLSEQTFPRLMLEYDIKQLDELQSQSFLTCSLDGWKDCSGNSIYAVKLMKGAAHYYIGNLNLTKQRHTANNIKCALLELLQRKVNLNQIAAIVTDSPSVMVKFRRDFVEHAEA
jgi:hypothetical protein